jgi:predicted AlkP superfamily phosphohydrolase/phosphomutase
MKKGRFLWSAHRITERQKAGKARNIKGKQLKNSRNTVSKQLVELLSSQRDNFSEKRISRVYYTSELRFWGVFCVNYDKINIIIKRKQV